MKLLGDAERGRLFSAMLLYAETGEEPDLKGNERFIWDTAKIEIDRQKDAYKNKVRGAEKARSLITSDIRGNQKQSDRLVLISAQDKDKDKDKDNIVISPDLPSGELGAAISSWFNYKAEKRQSYKTAGRTAFVSQCRNAAEKHGDAAVAEIIRRSMASNYQGVVWDWLNAKDARSARSGNPFLDALEGTQ